MKDTFVLIEMLGKIQSILIVMAIFIIAKEGFRISDTIKPTDAKSHAWHTFGSFIRLFVVGIFWEASHLVDTYIHPVNTNLNTAIFGISFILMYSIVCAYSSGKKHWYSLSKHGIDLVIRKVLFFIDFD